MGNLHHVVSRRHRHGKPLGLDHMGGRKEVVTANGLLPGHRDGHGHHQGRSRAFIKGDHLGLGGRRGALSAAANAAAPRRGRQGGAMVSFISEGIALIKLEESGCNQRYEQGGRVTVELALFLLARHHDRILVHEAFDQGAEIPSADTAAEGRARDDVIAVDPGKMDDDVAGLCTAENKPGIPLIGESLFCLDRKTGASKRCLDTVKLGEFLVGPVPRPTLQREKRDDFQAHPAACPLTDASANSMS